MHRWYGLTPYRRKKQNAPARRGVLLFLHPPRGALPCICLGP